ncbi:oligosaccharide repeat unit polymerase [Shewanella putrefaciens]|nr:oligosaccharide repeat unit polymerase [Shewanella putrefaciens]
MFSLISVLMLFIVFIAFNIPKLPVVLYFISFLLFSIALDGNEIGLWDYMYVHNDAINTLNVYFYWFSFLVSFIVFCFFLRTKGRKNFTLDIYSRGVNLVLLRNIARSFAVVAILATILNVSRVGDIQLMFLAPREWEKTFGRYVILNYLYFLHLCAIPLFICYFKHPLINFLKFKEKILDVILFFLCIIVSFFHGIKFTVLHAFVFAAFSLYIFSNFKFNKYIYILAFTFLSFIVLFFIFVRGGGVGGMLGYIASASVNSIYLINVNEFYNVGEFSSFFPFFDPDFISKIVDRLSGEFQSKGVDDSSGFFLNDKFNLFSGLTILSFTGPVGFVFWSMLLSILIKKMYNLNSLGKCFLLLHLLNVCLMLFTAWEFYKLKLIYVLLVGHVVSLYVMNCKQCNEKT